MKRIDIAAVACAAALLGAFGPASPAHAQIGVGTWVRQVGAATPGNMTLTVENELSSSAGGNPAGKTTETWVRK